LSPTSGAPDTVATVTGTGFTPNAAGWLWFDNNGNGVRDAGEPQVAVTTTAAGAIPSGNILVIPNVAAGGYQVLADITGGTTATSASFTVVARAIALSHASGGPGTVITITGNGFTSDTTGWLWFDNNGNGVRDTGEPQVSVTTTAAGAIPSGSTLAIPSVAAGSYQTRADIPSGGIIEASASFTVVGEGPSTSEPSALPPTDKNVSRNLSASNQLFNLRDIVVASEANVELTFHNEDAGVTHNFAIYKTGVATPIYQGTGITGPATIIYRFPAPSKGVYIFRCDHHPATMFGSFVVQ
jgi:hypothetical protein